VTPQPGDVDVPFPDLYRGALPTLTADDAATFDGTLIDARAPGRFRGETEPVDPVAGHIPGARNAPATEMLAADGTFLQAADLAGVLDRREVNGDIGVYCGSGVTAAVVIAALRSADVAARLFPGSWSEWSGDPERPVATGE
jgi:thiosulfate/3-mercaptopyruvate sulfurtransferase